MPELDTTAAYAAIDHLATDHAAQESAWLSERAGLLARIAELEPAPAPKPQRFGLNVTGGNIAGHREMLGGPDVDLNGIRLFFQPGEAPHWNDVKNLGIRPTDDPWFSAKTLTEATFRAWLRAMPLDFVAYCQMLGRPLRFTYKHECEADLALSEIPGYLATYAMMRRVCADEPNGRYVEPWKILLRYSQDEDPALRGSWPRFVGDQDVPVGVDCYWSGWVLNYWPAEDLLKTPLAIHEQTGLRIAVPEVGGVAKFTKKDGSRGRWDADGSKRAVALRQLVDFVVAHPQIESINWWCGTGAAGDHHLDAYPSNVAEWRRAYALDAA